MARITEPPWLPVEPKTVMRFDMLDLKILVAFDHAQNLMYEYLDLLKLT
jgi:hypothetical protein